MRYRWIETSRCFATNHPLNLGWEIAANGLNATSVLLAGRNSVHTWWTGIVGCAAFAYVFFDSRLYADVTLQVFFIGSSVVGWWNWLNGNQGTSLPVRRSSIRLILGCATLGLLATVGYGSLLHRVTNAYAPYLDSVILAFSVLGQFLLVARRVESWWCWLVVNTVAVPLYASRGLYLTAALYAAFWINAVVSLRHWCRLSEGQR